LLSNVMCIIKHININTQNLLLICFDYSRHLRLLSSGLVPQVMLVEHWSVMVHVFPTVKSETSNTSL